MAPSSKPLRRPLCRRTSPVRSGKITFVTLVALLGMAVLIGFVGNAGHVVTTKINTQNAADAIAFSSAQWMARGMNAVTATNHLLGEVTALVVVVEALGGPEADLDMVDYPPQSSIPDSVNRTLADMAYIQGLPIYGTVAAGRLDKQLVDGVVKRFVSKEGDDAKHRAFATIYDSKLVLKKAVTKRLLVKFFANWLLYVPPPWGYLSAAAAYVTHAVADVQLVEIGVEWVILHGLEKLVTAGDVVKRLKVDVLENQLIPALAAHGDYLAGRPTKRGPGRPTTESGIVNAAVRDTLDHLGEFYNVEAVIYPTATTYPLVQSLRLPIVAEAAPSERGTPVGKEELEWGTDELVAEDKDDQLAKIQEEINDKKRKIRRRIAELQESVAYLRSLNDEIEQLKTRLGVNDAELVEFKQEQDEIAADIAEKQVLIQQRVAELRELEAREKRMKETIESLAQAPPGSGNISSRREHLALAKLNQAEERTTQWVRATYPYVDAFRAPILKLFEDRLERSEAAKHFKKWTDRYTLTKAWKFRSGYRFHRTAENRGEWRKDRNTEILQMYVMAERFADGKPVPPRAGAARIQKGHEEWTQSTDSGQKMAEEMFTVVAVTHREIEPLFSPIIYPLASKNGVTTFAQAIYYNNNEQTPAQAGANTTTQAKLGWDTLNWAPSGSPPEWGAPPTVSQTAKWPWDIFRQDEAMLGRAAVRLNWQAKLMPVRSSRLTQAAGASAAALEKEMTENVLKALPLFDPMVTH